MNIGELTKNNSLAQIALPKLPRKKPLPFYMKWQTLDKKTVWISDMADSHLANCIVMLRKKSALDFNNSPKVSDEILFELVPSYYYMVEEAKRRLEKDKPAPEQPLRRRFRL